MRTITLLDFERDSTAMSLYCLNATKERKRGLVFFSVPRAGGSGLETVTVAATYIPVELTAQASRDQLLASSDFRKALSKRDIVLVNSDDAINFLKTDPGAQIELERLQNSHEHMRNIMKATDIEDLPETNIVDPALQETSNLALDNAQLTSDDGRINGVLASVIHLVENLRETRADQEAINSVRSLGEISPSDYKYMYKNAPEDAKLFTSWARQQYQNSVRSSEESRGTQQSGNRPKQRDRK